jgi:hypothetical protein
MFTSGRLFCSAAPSPSVILLVEVEDTGTAFALIVPSPLLRAFFSLRGAGSTEFHGLPHLQSVWGCFAMYPFDPQLAAELLIL